MNGSIRKSSLTGMVIVGLLAGVLLIAGCGGSSDSTSDPISADQAAAGGPGGGMFANLTDDQQQCLEDAGVTIPDMPEDGQGQPPEGMSPPDGAPPGGTTGASGATGPQGSPPQSGQGMSDLQELQAAMEECGIEMPDSPQDAQAS
jgi:hypothetical protein